VATTEHELIREIRALLRDEAVLLPDARGVLLGPGDDCAVTTPEAGRELLLTTDASVEGVHFRLDWMGAEAVGRRAMTANLSDVAAMGGRPRWALLALAAPRDTPRDTLLAIVRGAARSAAHEGAPVVGGNIAGTGGPLSVTITLAGDAPAGTAVRRTGAEPGDELWASGRPGAARVGLLLHERGLTGLRGAAPFLDAFQRPLARVALGDELRARGLARAMIDLSDGLAQDLGHVLEASGVGARLDAASLLAGLGDGFAAVCARLEADPVAVSLEGGEDYELLFAARPGAVGLARADLVKRHGVPLVRVGVVEAAPGLRGPDGAPLRARGYDHFSS